MNFQYLQLCLVVLCYVKQCRGQESGGPLWWKTIPTTPPDNRDPDLLPFYDNEEDEGNVCCECVSFYICSDNNTIITDGGGSLSPRFGGRNRVRNVETCPEAAELCCRPPNAMVGCQMNKTAPLTNRVTLNPNTLCECIEWELCPEELRISDGSSPTTLVDGTTPLQRHSKCPHSLEVCCALDSLVTPPASSTGGDCFCVNPLICGRDGIIITDGAGGMNQRATTPNGPPCVPPKVCCREPVDGVSPSTKVPTTPEPPLEDQKCSGIRNRKGVSVRIGGFIQGESQFGEFPWAGMVLRTYHVAGEPEHSFVGGAVLIHPRVMISAAHKVANETVASLTVRVGEWDVKTKHEPAAHQTHYLESVVIHPNFDSRTLYHDVALLFLTEPVVLYPHIRSICIATSVDEVEQSACVTNGWGEDSFGSGNYQTVMKSVTLPLVPSKRCEALLRKTRLGKWFKLHPSFICAGGEAGKDACSSDGGGPLACPRRGSTSGEYLLVGITAWGIDCGGEGVPGVYASTIADNQWITAEVEKIIPSHSIVRRAVIDKAEGGLRGGRANLGDQGSLNKTSYASVRCRTDAKDCSLAASAHLPVVTQPTATTPGTPLSTIASTTQVTAAISTTTEVTQIKEKSGKWRRTHRRQQQHQRLETLRRKLERQRRKTERQERRNMIRN